MTTINEINKEACWACTDREAVSEYPMQSAIVSEVIAGVARWLGICEKCAKDYVLQQEGWAIKTRIKKECKSCRNFVECSLFCMFSERRFRITPEEDRVITCESYEEASHEKRA